MANRRGEIFRPNQEYAHRLRKILEEYPDGSQILREILQNSDDAKSRKQIFILDNNNYPTQKLLEPRNEGTRRTDAKLDRYQGPALLSRNDTIFEERDFDSLLKLADSEKRKQFDKIGAMGMGFNSIYHLTDSPSFITGNSYVILDPHEWYYNGGIKFNFIEEAVDFPDQFAPFRTFKIPFDHTFEGTFFRYPLRTSEDSIDSVISKKVYKPDDVREMFKRFYENEGINCLLFLKYIEVIEFYELEEGETEPKLLYEISLENADEVRSKRRQIAENVVKRMESLDPKGSNKITPLESIYIAEFFRKNYNGESERISWVIFNQLNETDVLDKFKGDFKEHKLVPAIGLAVRLDNQGTNGRLFCFLPLPIPTPFRASINGYFAVGTNRRTIWSSADNEDLADDSLAKLKVTWNEHLFDKVLPKAWVRFLVELPNKYPSVQPSKFYDFWPILSDHVSSSVVEFCKQLLEKVVENLKTDDEVFIGPRASYAPGNMKGLIPTNNN
ncbi:13231_t:CDS:2, partial [Acaulospora colombiana]